VETTLKKDDAIGCVILEPTGGHWGQVPVREEWQNAILGPRRLHYYFDGQRLAEYPASCW
ncbi:MAG: hypothetical protein LBV50_02585, partial [Novosphingobium sp.]|nr:hypothetical protein [Novosphingobium sp.]